MTRIIRLTPTQVSEIETCHPESKCECYCDDTHVRTKTVCMYCWYVRPDSRPPIGGVYGEWCQDETACKHLGYCPRQPTCAD
jgi:hypothetical protein